MILRLFDFTFHRNNGAVQHNEIGDSFGRTMRSTSIVAKMLSLFILALCSFIVSSLYCLVTA